VLSARKAAAEALRHDSALAELSAIVAAAPFGIVALDRQGCVLTMNPAAGRMLGLPPALTVGRLLIELVRAPELDALLAGARQTQLPAEAELTFATGGNRRVARAVAAPLTSASTDAACVVVIEEITELRRLEAVRSEFVANVSHELRTPITSVRGYAETLLDGFELDPTARKFVGVIHRNATRLGSIIDDLLLLASLEGAQEGGSVEMMPVRLHAVLREAVEQHSQEAQQRGTRLECTCDPGLTTLGSAGLLGLAVGNLLANAIKYSPDHSTVRLVARADQEQVVVDVQDEGPGMPAQHLPRLFERFYRVDKARSRESGGTGLGLAIVKHVAQAHGGSVEVESKSGAGSRFRLRLPLHQEVSPPQIAPNA
jgi:two-component system phosphate regulon sensor histidine kinase PhoR